MVTTRLQRIRKVPAYLREAAAESRRRGQRTLIFFLVLLALGILFGAWVIRLAALAIWFGDQQPPANQSATFSGQPAVSGSSAGGEVQVRGYTRSDGTHVAPHTRSAPHHK